ncbi:MAG: hypothetical protein LBD13_05950, partial [Spirochaetaceae bacterium]|nr:hypothetical protein [Spirochaetaceae bacterium]
MEYNGKTVVAWLKYNENYMGEDTNRVLYVFPRYVKGNKGLKQVFDPMPEECINDRIAIYLPSGWKEDVSEVYATYGPLVKIKFNDEPKLSPKNPNLEELKSFTALFKNVEIEKLYEQIMQILHVADDFRTLCANRYIEYPASQLFSNDLIVGTTDNAYYGPFDAAQEGKKIALSSKKQHHFFIKKYAVSEIERLSMPIYDDKENIQAVFIQKHLFQKHEPFPQDDRINRIDWMSDEELVNKLKSILKTFEDPSRKYTKKEINTLSETVQSAAALNSDIIFMRERYEKLDAMLNIIGDQDSFMEQEIIPRMMKNAEFFDNFVTLLQEDEFKKIEERNGAFSRVRERLASLEAEKEAVKKEIENLRAGEKELEAGIERLKDMEIRLRDQIAGRLAEFSNAEET